MQFRVSRSIRALVLPAVFALGGCDVSVGNLTGRATEEITRTFPLAEGGEVRISNTNGRVDVQPGDEKTVEIRIEKIARAATDVGAKELLPRINIKEDASPELVSLETARMGGIMIGVSFEVRYHVRAPKNATINATTTNGGILVTGMSGKVIAHTTNGGVTGKELTGGVEARSTNGGVNLDMASVGIERISARTTNGGVTLMVPESAKADVTATCTNGGIVVSPDLKMEVFDQTRRRLEGRLNGGGSTAIELHTTNGGVRIKPRGAMNAEATDDNDDDRPPKPPKPPTAPKPPQ
jgi:putative adhesin